MKLVKTIPRYRSYKSPNRAGCREVFVYGVEKYVKGKINMYTYADFSTVQELPDVVNVSRLSEAIGLSTSRTYEIIRDIEIPHLKLGKKFIIFKEHLIETLSGKRVFTSVSNLNAIKRLPRVFNPKRLQDALGVSNGTAYVLVREPGFPAVFSRNRIVISKTGFIDWIRANEKHICSLEEVKR